MTGRELRQMRVAAGFYVGLDFAAAMGISKDHLSRMENNKAPITRVTELAARYLCEVPR